MDDNMKWLNEIKIDRTIDALKENGINGYYVKSRQELIDLITTLTKEGIQYLVEVQ